MYGENIIYEDKFGPYKKTGIINRYGETILRDNEKICPSCKGKGNFKGSSFIDCDICDGDGKVLWSRFI